MKSVYCALLFCYQLMAMVENEPQALAYLGNMGMPVEVAHHIYSFLPPQDAFSCGSLSKNDYEAYQSYVSNHRVLRDIREGWKHKDYVFKITKYKNIKTFLTEFETKGMKMAGCVDLSSIKTQKEKDFLHENKDIIFHALSQMKHIHKVKLAAGSNYDLALLQLFDQENITIYYVKVNKHPFGTFIQGPFEKIKNVRVAPIQFNVNLTFNSNSLSNFANTLFPNLKDLHMNIFLRYMYVTSIFKIRSDKEEFIKLITQLIKRNKNLENLSLTITNDWFKGGQPFYPLLTDNTYKLNRAARVNRNFKKLRVNSIAVNLGGKRLIKYKCFVRTFNTQEG